ncbi:MAG: endonuclease/exonuclease/phosphatase family protein [Bacteroidota bacterium]|jgi:hypothetical protein
MKNLIILLFLIFVISIFGQGKRVNDKNTVCIAFYNVENLYDTIDEPNVIDDEFTPKGDNKWTAERFNKKIENISMVLGTLGSEKTEDGPAIIGLCEIENYSCLNSLVSTKKLKKNNYKIVHYDGPDERGVDVAFLYQPKKFKLISSKTYRCVLSGDDAKPTRDQLLVTGKLLGQRIHFIICHWPSRRGGMEGSASKRMTAANVGRKIIDSILIAEPNANIVLMGDLNDDPDQESITIGLHASSDSLNTDSKQLYNAMQHLFSTGRGTLSYKEKWNLFDQMILSKPLITGSGNLKYRSSEIFDKEIIREKEGKYKGTPFRTYAGNKYLGGYSDHFPVYIFLNKEK